MSGVKDEPESVKHEVGARVACLSSWDNLYHSAEVVQIKDSESGVQYYVHYIEYNKRLDEWLPHSRVEPWKGVGDSKPAVTGTLRNQSLVSSDRADVDSLATGVGKGTVSRKITRNLKRRYDGSHYSHKDAEELTPRDNPYEKDQEELTKVKNIQVVEFGKFEVDTWYYSPYPEEYGQQEKLFVCEFCFKYMRKRKTWHQHKIKCGPKHPPGDQIYKMEVPDPPRSSLVPSGLDSPPRPPKTLSVFEIDGANSKLYCQNLCLFAKLFLDHKSLFFAVSQFVFYVLAEESEGSGSHAVGYFSKEKSPSEEFNMACILTFPPFQRLGYGRFLIAFAYELSKLEGKVGTPERPLSDLGQLSFRSFWTRVILEVLKEHKANVTIKDISCQTSIRQDDIISTLQSLNLLKYWKGQHVISVTPRAIEEHLRALRPQLHWHIQPHNIHWTPKLYPSLGKRSRGG